MSGGSADGNIPIMLVDDEPMILRGVSVALNRAGMENVVAIEDSRQVLPMLEEVPVSAIVLDLQMPFMMGNELLPVIRQRFPHIPVIVLTANAELESAVDCMKMGAYDYLVKPVDPKKLITTLQRALELGELRTEVESLRMHMLSDDLDEGELFSRFITVNDTMRNILRYGQAIAKTRAPVLICGEAGVGKGPFAKLIHEASGRPGNFVRVHVGGMSDEDFRGAVFGFRLGAVAQAGDIGGDRLPSAKEGTLYLEGLGTLNMRSQERILELLEDGTYSPLGAPAPLRTSVRVIVSSRSMHPEQDVEKGTLHQELYRRLKDHMVVIPPLRDRVEDVPVLLSAFLDEACKRMSVEKTRIPGDILVRFLQYGFPGNVSELEVMVRDAVHGTAAGGSLEDAMRKQVLKVAGSEDAAAGFGEAGVVARSVTKATQSLIEAFGHFPTMEEATDFLIDESLKVTKGNKKAAAALLQITRQTINRRLRLRLS